MKSLKPLITDEQVINKANEYREKYCKIDKSKIKNDKVKSKKMILCIGDINRICGIPLLLLTIEGLIEKDRKLLNEIVFFIYAFHPRSQKIRPAIQEFSRREVKTKIKTD